MKIETGARPSRLDEPYDPETGMETVACNLCGSTETELVQPANTSAADLRAAAFACTSPGIGQHGTIVRCRCCGLVYTNPRPTGELLDALYAAVEDPVYLDEEEARVATFRHALLGVRKREPRGRLLDVGCHVGTFLALARDAGYGVAGVEPSAWATDQARARGLDVHACGVAEAGFAPGSFDIVTMWDVIEHVADPKGEMEKVRALLRPDGLFALTTMNVGGLVPRLLGGRWPWYMLMHQHYFTLETIGRMLAETGFETVAVEPHVRITHARYLASKLGAYSRGASSLVKLVLERTGLGDLRIPVNLGDQMTVYARAR